MLYTVRAACARDFEGTLREVGRLGYEGVELFDLHGCRPEDVRAWLDDAGLVACGRHAGLEAVERDLAALATEAELVGWRRLVVSWLDPAAIASDPGALRERLVRAAAEAARHGLELGLHNHDAEVRPGPSGRSFLDDLPPEAFLELDIGWPWWAGVDPAPLLAGCPLVHVKDFRARGERAFCPVGDGEVPYELLAPAAVQAGVEWLLVEQDETDGPELEAAARSLEALSRMLQAAA
jgi:sugar phosphate isomerase/epimerase